MKVCGKDSIIVFKIRIHSPFPLTPSRQINSPKGLSYLLKNGEKPVDIFIGGV
jgi:hypothetical protein